LVKSSNRFGFICVPSFVCCVKPSSVAVTTQPIASRALPLSPELWEGTGWVPLQAPNRETGLSPFGNTLAVQRLRGLLRQPRLPRATRGRSYAQLCSYGTRYGSSGAATHAAESSITGPAACMQWPKGDSQEYFSPRTGSLLLASRGDESIPCRMWRGTSRPREHPRENLVGVFLPCNPARIFPGKRNPRPDGRDCYRACTISSGRAASCSRVP
jgi:hypothetical protein